MSEVQGPDSCGQAADLHVQQEASLTGASPQQPQQAMSENSGRLSPGAVIGYTLLIIVPLMLCCITIEFFALAM
jgi:hypothetical protein